MHRNNLITALEDYKKSRYIEKNEEGKVDRFIDFVTYEPRCCERIPGGHVTGSACIVDRGRTHTLLTHHKKLNMWLQLGGHADGNYDVRAVAVQEAREESGLPSISFVTQEIYDIDIHVIPNMCGFHYDVRFLMEADMHQKYIVSEESNDLAWVDLGHLAQYSHEESLLRMARKLRVL